MFTSLEKILNYPLNAIGTKILLFPLDHCDLVEQKPRYSKWFTRKANHQNNHEGRRINNKNSRKIIFVKFLRRKISDIKNLKKIKD